MMNDRSLVDIRAFPWMHSPAIPRFLDYENGVLSIASDATSLWSCTGSTRTLVNRGLLDVEGSLQELTAL